ncbi:MAG: molybdopterin-guanine dinucleotide biosynthesis protein B [Syntrophales bacterium LBB04]|nr:molybdopterin-guanine dinucleotide biosynthesis protein B [Syntrophales bacterium LBB04]
MTRKIIPVVCIVGESNTGKTTLIEKIIPELTSRGYRVATIKHHGHGFDIDHEGKDSWRHKQAGARMTVLSSSQRVAIVEDVEKDLTIEELRDLYIHDCDIVVTEGFKYNLLPKIEVFRADLKDKIISRGDDKLLAVVGDMPPDPGAPHFDRNDIRGIVDLIETRFLR